MAQINWYSADRQTANKDIAIVRADAGLSQQSRAAIDEIRRIRANIDNIFDLDIIVTIIALVIASSAAYWGSRMIIKPLHEMAEDQRRFIDDAAHELRTPLSTMKTISEVALLRTNKATKKELKSVIKENVEEIDRMTAMIKNLFYLSRVKLIDKGYAGEEAKFGTVNISDTISSAIELTKNQASAKNINLRSMPATNSSPILVLGNKFLLEEALVNIIRNSINYTPNGGTIILGMRVPGNAKEKNYAEIYVRDTGCGIPKDEVPFIFQPFYRSKMTQHTGGSGIGLTIVKRIVNQHHGRVSAESAVNKGTTIKFTLPLYKEEG